MTICKVLLLIIVQNDISLNRDLKLQIAQLPGKSGSSLQKDYSPERIYFETLQKRKVYHRNNCKRF